MAAAKRPHLLLSPRANGPEIRGSSQHADRETKSQRGPKTCLESQSESGAAEGCLSHRAESLSCRSSSSGQDLGWVRADTGDRRIETDVYSSRPRSGPVVSAHRELGQEPTSASELGYGWAQVTREGLVPPPGFLL